MSEFLKRANQMIHLSLQNGPMLNDDLKKAIRSIAAEVCLELIVLERDDAASSLREIREHPVPTEREQALVDLMFQVAIGASTMSSGSVHQIVHYVTTRLREAGFPVSPASDRTWSWGVLDKPE